MKLPVEAESCAFGSIASPLIPAQAGIQRPKTAEGRQNIRPVPPRVPVDDEVGLRPDTLRWIPACAGMSGFGSRQIDHAESVSEPKP